MTAAINADRRDRLAGETLKRFEQIRTSLRAATSHRDAEKRLAEWRLGFDWWCAGLADGERWYVIDLDARLTFDLYEGEGVA